VKDGTTQTKMDIDDDEPTTHPLLMREFGNGNMFCIVHPVSDDLMNKIGHKCKLSIIYTHSGSRQCIGHYDKNNRCMMLKGEVSLTYFISGASIMLTNYENDNWVHHVIWEQQPIDGTRIVNTTTNESLTTHTEHGMIITIPETY
jgi:hypothetical protein